MIWLNIIEDLDGKRRLVSTSALAQRLATGGMSSFPWKSNNIDLAIRLLGLEDCRGEHTPKELPPQVNERVYYSGLVSERFYVQSVDPDGVTLECSTCRGIKPHQVKLHQLCRDEAGALCLK